MEDGGILELRMTLDCLRSIEVGICRLRAFSRIEWRLCFNDGNLSAPGAYHHGNGTDPP